MPVGMPNQVHGALPHPSPLEDLHYILRDIDFHQRAPAQRRSPQEKGALWGHIFPSSLNLLRAAGPRIPVVLWIEAPRMGHLIATSLKRPQRLLIARRKQVEQSRSPCG